MKYVIAYDLGTGGAKASLVDAEGHILESTFVGYETFNTPDGRQEQRPDDWWKAIKTSTKELLCKKGEDISANIVALAISGHSLGVVPIGRDGTLLRDRTPIWSDKRAACQAAAFFKKVDPEEWYMTTGNGFPAPCYSVFKIMWYRDNEPEMFARTDKVIGTKDYCNYMLTGVLATDPSYASGSGVFALKEWRYDDALIDASGLDASIFPDIIPSDCPVGTIKDDVATEMGLTPGIPVMAGGVDNSCMALGAKGICDGRVYTSLGSSAWIALVSREPVLDTKYKPYVFAHLIPGMYASATAIFSAGTTHSWVRDNLCEGLSFDEMTELAQTSPIGSNGLLFNPSLAGGSMLDPTDNMAGCLFGLKLSHSRADIIRAAMEGIALNLKFAFEVLGSYGTRPDKMLMTGGGAKSVFWMQIFADIYGIPIEKTNIDQQAATLGAAALALKGSGLWPDYKLIDSIHVTGAQLHPENSETYAPVYRKFLKLIEMIGTLNDNEP